VIARALCVAPLRAGVILDALARHHLEERSLAVKVAAGLLAGGAVAVLAHLVGADLRAGYGAGQPDLAQHAVRLLITRPAALG
jgi:hypothetical protein